MRAVADRRPRAARPRAGAWQDAAPHRVRGGLRVMRRVAHPLARRRRQERQRRLGPAPRRVRRRPRRLRLDPAGGAREHGAHDGTGPDAARAGERQGARRPVRTGPDAAAF
eukprot:7378818-Prymnesium_polylepis.1